MRAVTVSAPVLHVRSAHPGDMPYVLATWVRSYAMGQSSARRQQAILDFRRRYVDAIMAQDPHIVVLCSPSSHSTLHGYAVVLHGGLAWAYVAKPLRREGYARQVITSALRYYPESIRTHSRWPWESERYRFEKLQRAA